MLGHLPPPRENGKDKSNRGAKMPPLVSEVALAATAGLLVLGLAAIPATLFVPIDVGASVWVVWGAVLFVFVGIFLCSTRRKNIKNSKARKAARILLLVLRVAGAEAIGLLLGVAVVMLVCASLGVWMIFSLNGLWGTVLLIAPAFYFAVALPTLRVMVKLVRTRSWRGR